jgi:hypothetical protein
MTAPEKLANHSGKTDWKRISALSDDEIEVMAKEDADNPATTMLDWAHANSGQLPEKPKKAKKSQ